MAAAGLRQVRLVGYPAQQAVRVLNGLNARQAGGGRSGGKLADAIRCLIADADVADLNALQSYEEKTLARVVHRARPCHARYRRRNATVHCSASAPGCLVLNRCAAMQQHELRRVGKLVDHASAHLARLDHLLQPAQLLIEGNVVWPLQRLVVSAGTEQRHVPEAAQPADVSTANKK